MNIFKKIKESFHLQPEETYQETYTEIQNGAAFKGYNLWIMICAMIVACIGLTVDSLSAVIGAMLISPLMGPIVGFGFALAINDRLLKLSSLRNWIIMSVVSLIAAYIYFKLNPFTKITIQSLSFQRATLFDIVLAICGGIAGFIGIMKKDGSKILAGVAVATSCMPPLCVAAEGASQMNLDLFAGGLYFYLINCLFIGLSTFLLARYFSFQNHEFGISNKSKLWVVWAWRILIVAMLMPGTYLAYKKWKDEYTVAKPSVGERLEALEKKMGK
jgi:uncharacterized hydrophobic protein (TIGR00271 family)